MPVKQPKPRVLSGRKILIASLGVATVSYACGGSTSGTNSTEGGVVGASGGHAGASAGGFTSGNLMPPPSGGAGGKLNAGGAGNTGGVLLGGFTSGNLMAPPPTGGKVGNVDASSDAAKDAP
jgi:hypothetical protein